MHIYIYIYIYIYIRLTCCIPLDLGLGWNMQEPRHQHGGRQENVSRTLLCQPWHFTARAVTTQGWRVFKCLGCRVREHGGLEGRWQDGHLLGGRAAREALRRGAIVGGGERGVHDALGRRDCASFRYVYAQAWDGVPLRHRINPRVGSHYKETEFGIYFVLQAHEVWVHLYVYIYTYIYTYMYIQMCLHTLCVNCQPWANVYIELYIYIQS